MIAAMSAFPLQRYLAARGLTRGQSAMIAMGVIALHGVLLAAAFWSREEVSPPLVPPTMSVSFIAEQPPAPAAETPPPEPTPPPPEPPKPLPKVVASSKPTPAPIVAPPPEEVTESEPIEEAPPPAAPVAAAAPTQSAVVPPDFTADYLNNPGPQYPYASRRRREQGTVTLKVLVTEAGAPAQVLVETSSGYATLDEAALDIVKRRWRFVPAKEDGRAVEAWVLVPIIFELKNR
jgi:protein TonB